MRSITNRWVRGSLLFTILVVLIAESVLVFFVYNSYYFNVEQTMQSKLASIEKTLSFYKDDTANHQSQIRKLAESFDAKEQFELMLINYNGEVVSTSSGVVPTMKEKPKDVYDLLFGGSIGPTKYIGANENGDRVIAMSIKTPFISDTIVAVRLVSSLELVDGAIWSMINITLVVVAIIILVSIFSGIYFIRSIVLPLQKVEATAAMIAQGNFETRIDNSSQDEIGKLCKTINNMAEELSKNERLKNEFISSVSHELRTPLTSIKGWTETISKMDNPKDPSFRRGVDIISGETDRLYDMVEELLDFSRMQSSGVVLQKELLDMAAEVEDAVLIAEQRAKHMSISIVYEAPLDPMPVYGERNRIRQVLLNVIDNAIKYSYSGGNIFLNVTVRDPDIVVSVRDEGVGIALEDIENVSKKFYKGKGATRGSGIGLAVVEEILRAHGGALEIESVQNTGTTVLLLFPIEKLSTTTEL